jgi:hypothetical protein
VGEALNNSSWEHRSFISLLAGNKGRERDGASRRPARKASRKNGKLEEGRGYEREEGGREGGREGGCVHTLVGRRGKRMHAQTKSVCSIHPRYAMLSARQADVSSPPRCFRVSL